MSSWPRQADLNRFLAAEARAGRDPSLAACGRALGWTKSRVRQVREGLMVRLAASASVGADGGGAAVRAAFGARAGA